ncbi:hypothetical protein I316_06927 [Kwoniella heveanensis BCC8398]|uniref:Uncharacterized protein n=1 Tax=Kwoniella heveanensis BCC8398 TaxID=1296120 RepID=A0A1B9GK40_9TREE|nr:hypothetical protein I316_06927 [Kwoniella heveanensis BCC8398]
MSLSSRTASVSTYNQHYTSAQSQSHGPHNYGIGMGLGGPAGSANHGHSHGHGHGHGGGRSVSANYSIKEKGKDNGGLALRRPEDVFRLVRERMLSWSYMMEWYQGDTHWLNTVRIPRHTLETVIGPKSLETRARNYYILGISMSALFDIQSSGEFLKALLKLLDDWESWAEGSGGKGVKNLFRGQRNARKVTAGGSIMSDFAASMDGAESYLLNVNLPFVPDFYQTHSSICSIIRDIYKKLLSMFLPPPSTSSSALPAPSNSLHHPSTIIQSAPLDIPFGSVGGGGPPPKSPAASIATATFASHQVTSPTSEPGHGYNPSSFGGNANPAHVAQTFGGSAASTGGDALQAFIAGELPSDRTLVGDGQKLTPQVVELFLKVDGKLKKHFSTLLREGDTLARRVLDDELASLLQSLNPGAKALNFDYNAATTNSGAGWSTSNITAATTSSISSNVNVNTNMGTVSGIHGGLMGLMEEERQTRERDFGTI